MSKMPAKKKSCFQITSVTQAQVAAVGAADDTESLDDPDESRTEDVSSEIYDMSRAEHEPACDRSSSEEALNNVGEPAEAGGVTLPSGVPPAGQLPAPLGNPVGELRKVGVSGPSQSGQQPPGIGVTSGLPPVTQPGGIQPQPPPVAASTGPAGLSLNASHPAAPPATSTVSCSSRFRVIKLDHGTGEPFRRGRWTCTEFYEKDSDASLSGRTVDSIRHASVTLDPAADRDSGLGLTGGSVVSPATHSSLGLGSAAEASHSSARVHPGETLPQQQILQQGYGGGTSATHGSFTGVQPTGPGPAPSAVGGPQPPAGQNVLPVGQNGLPQPGVHMQKSPVMPPSAQPVAYHPQQQGPVGHHLTGQSSGPIQSQTEYYQQQQQQSTPMPPAHATGQSLPGVPQAAGQGPAAAMPPAPGAASVPGQGADAPGAGGGAASAGLAAPAVLQQQTVGLGGTGGSILVGGSTLPQPPASQYAAAGQPHPLGHPAASGVQTVPAIAVSSSVSTNVPAAVPTAVPSASSAAMPNATSSGLPPGHISHSRTPVALGMQGLPMTGFGLMEGMQSPIISGRELVKPFMPESLQLTTPTVNSLFGIHIPVDGEEDRNPSTAFYQAFQYGSRLRDSKAHSDSASGTNIVAIDNKIEQAMDLVKSHLMYAVREEVEVLKEQIKELYERNSVLERENAVLKSLANSEQLSQLSTQSAATPPQQGLNQPQPQQQQQHPQPQPQPQPQLQLQHHPKPQQLQTQPQLDPGKQLQPNVTSA